MADPVSVVKDYDAAWNAHDVEGVLAFSPMMPRSGWSPLHPMMSSAESIQAKSRYELASSNRLLRASTSTPATMKYPEPKKG